MRKAQSSTELLLLVGILFLLFFAVLYYNRWELLSLLEQRRQSQLEDVAEFLENEIRLAALAEPGYARTFSLPGRLGSQHYEVVVVNSANFTEVVVRFVNTSRHFERTVVAGPGLSGNVSINSSKGEVPVSITKPNATHILFS